MKIKTCDLIGPALDWAVSTCEGYTNLRRNVHRFDNGWIMDPPRIEFGPVLLADNAFSSDWALGGPIIERKGISCFRHHMTAAPWVWCAHQVIPRPNMEGGFSMTAIAIEGPTPLISAMRCHVASELGDEVDIPEELIK